MQIGVVMVWGVLFAFFFIAALVILMKAQKKLLKGELKNIVFWVYALLLDVFIVIVLLLATSFLEEDPLTLQMMEVLITVFIIISGLCAIRVAMLFLSFANVYGFAEAFKEKALKTKMIKKRKR